MISPHGEATTPHGTLPGSEVLSTRSSRPGVTIYDLLGTHRDSEGRGLGRRSHRGDRAVDVERVRVVARE
ncbi:hypothetical protein QJS66_16630 [Kocuria rhizophila]|nr:hypothetical protein QJS66_16630 [Kocuria rhizophila]